MTKTPRIFLTLALALVALATAAAPATAAPRTPAKKQVKLSSYESAILSSINSIRARYGLARLQHSARLSTAARAHSLAMGRRGFFAHESANGEEFWKRVERFYGPKGFGHWQVGENLVWGSDLDVAMAMKLWMSSPGHRRNILTAGWREIGISAVFVPSAPGVFGGHDAMIVTTDFGVRR